jgi:hypothetical protein
MLSSEITDALNTLRRGCEGIETVMNTNRDENRFSQALEALQRLALDHRIPIAIVGGLGAIRYGYAAATQDIDVAIGLPALSKLLLLAPAYGFKVASESKSGWHTLTHGDVEINVVPEGSKARDTSPTTIPSPEQMGVEVGLSYAPIERWMELKISSGRQKDRAHIVEVLKKTDPETVTSIRNHLAKTHTAYVDHFELLLTESIAEDRQERERR